jgi:hypothetical protein
MPIRCKDRETGYSKFLKMFKFLISLFHYAGDYSKRMRSSLVVRASDCQCTSCNGPGFDPSIRRHSGIWGAADEAVLNIVRKKKIILSYSILEPRCCPGHSKEKFRTFLTHSETLLTLSVHWVRLCLRWVYTEWDSAYTGCTLYRLRLCLFLMYMEWDPAYTEVTWSEKTLLIPSKRVRLLCLTEFTTVHRLISLSLYWVYME